MPTDSASTWMAPSAALATGATRWHLMGRVAKVPEELLVQTQSPLTRHTSTQRFPWAPEFLALARS